MNTFAKNYLDSQSGKLAEELKKAYLAGQHIVYVVTKDYAVVRETIDREPLFFLRSLPKTEIGMTQVKNGVTTSENVTAESQNLFFGEEELKNFNPKVPSMCIVTLRSQVDVGESPMRVNEYLKLFVDRFNDLSSYRGSEAIKKSMVIIVTPHMVSVPSEIALYSRIVRVEEPSEREVIDKIGRLIEELDGKNLTSLIGSQSYIQRMTNLTKGLSLNKIAQIFSRVKSELDHVFIPVQDKDEFAELEKIILEEKSQLIENSAILKLIKSSKSKHKTNGMGRLTQWLDDRKRVIQNPDDCMYDGFIPQPKGILLAGIPGTGKSLAAKTTASVFGNLPLLQMDMGNILDKYQGESEHKMEEALKLAEAMSPCVLWIDEIEKGIAGAGNSSGNSESMKRVFGKLLTWMQEKEDHGVCCFVFATANSIDNIPPELFRSGRFDEKFFTFFPSASECVEIFQGNLRAQDKAYRSYCEKNGHEVRPLFDEAIFDDQFILAILNSRNVLVDPMTTDQKHVSKENKFMTGSDIEAIIERTKLIMYNRKSVNTNVSSCVYDLSDFRDALFEALAEIRTYGQTNARQVAECFAQLSEYNFHSVSLKEVIPFRFFDSNAEKNKPLFNLKSDLVKEHLSKLETEYDRQLFLYLGLAANQYLTRKSE